MTSDERIEAKAKELGEIIFSDNTLLCQFITTRDLGIVARAVLVREIEAVIKEYETQFFITNGKYFEAKTDVGIFAQKIIKQRIAELTAELEQIRGMG